MNSKATKLGALGLVGAAAFVCTPQLFSGRPPVWAAKPDPRRVERPADDGTFEQDRRMFEPAVQTVAETDYPGTNQAHRNPSNDDLSNRFETAFLKLSESLRPNSDSIHKTGQVRDEDTRSAPHSSGWMAAPRGSHLEAFAQTARLHGVLIRESVERVANLSGRLVQAGQVLGHGISVHEIGDAFVVLAEGEERVKLVVHPVATSWNRRNRDE
ncbi:MAG: hypothetical protein ACI8TQ_002011 [Planctomycetota bacterium]|jgi:hypothetical protein